MSDQNNDGYEPLDDIGGCRASLFAIVFLAVLVSAGGLIALGLVVCCR